MSNESYTNENFSTWNMWSEIHNDSDQQKRVKSATKAELTPLSINSNECTATFQGRSKQYSTTLESCNCVDYGMRHLPCKHMYRLAMELGLYNATYKSDVSKAKQRSSSISFSDYVDLIETLTPTDQQKLLDFLYMFIYQKDKYACLITTEPTALISSGILVDSGPIPEILDYFKRNELNDMVSKLNVPFKKNMATDTLIQWCIDNLSDRMSELLSGYTAVKMNDDYAVYNSKLYKYLHRKYDSESYFNPDTGDESGIRLLDTDLPEDSVTAELTKHGYYDPTTPKKYYKTIIFNISGKHKS